MGLFTEKRRVPPGCTCSTPEDGWTNTCYHVSGWVYNWDEGRWEHPHEDEAGDR